MRSLWVKLKGPRTYKTHEAHETATNYSTLQCPLITIRQDTTSITRHTVRGRQELHGSWERPKPWKAHLSRYRCPQHLHRCTPTGRFAVTQRYCIETITLVGKYRGADKSLARRTSRCILFDGENISFDASLVIYINSTNIPPLMIINRTRENQNLLSL